ncbi:AAA family ATPase [Paeniroseomonas aquatica]|uniref:AAA family ATPase n=1 Tax=Paeniroseomonas aquatica TaxID=373043 RepID=A0ABT8A3S4_9PROT|nr:AAA family ATPase [Paeniroseomonas aquatica]MDN3564349.1 AAA family ATPase [Paeniroseomonas aquatica]
MIGRKPSSGPAATAHPDQYESHGGTSVRDCNPSGSFLVCFLARSKRFPGIGLGTAHRLWRAHGPALYGILAGDDPCPLHAVLGEERAADLLHAWQEDQAESDVAVWLDENRLDPRLANKVIAVWGKEGAAKLRANPYVMLTFAEWPKVDAAAHRVGIDAADPRRLVGAVEADLYARLAQKDTAVRRDVLVASICRMLGRGTALAEYAIDLAITEGGAVLAPGGCLLQPAGAAVMERYIEGRILDMQLRSRQAGLFDVAIRDTDVEAELADSERGSGHDLTPEQQRAVRMAVNAGISLLIGGAGVGKTTTLRAVHSIMVRHGQPVLQMALAGRAAQRLREATGCHAYTIAGFLMQVSSGRLKVPPDALVVVDEASMLDLPAAYRILRALPRSARLLLVGDPAQLSPIGFGLVFHIAASERRLPIVELTRVHRQAAETGIPLVAAAVRSGHLPSLPMFGFLPFHGVSALPCQPEQLGAALVDAVSALGGIGACQILSPLRKGETGSDAINALFHATCAPTRRHVPDRRIAVGEPVVWTVNDWERGLMNGSLGYILEVDSLGNTIIEMDGVVHRFGRSDNLQALQLAYAITVHKAQGSQFQRVVVPIFPSRLLDRTLIYTAITRATEQVVLVGDITAAERAIRAMPRSETRTVGLKVLAA